MDLKITAGAPTHAQPTAVNTDRDGVRVAPPRGYVLSGKIMLSAVVVLFSVVLLILFVHLYVRWRVYRRASRRHRRRLTFSEQSPAAAAASCGLDPIVLKSLSVEVFYASNDLAGECAVCLCEFDDGEKVRVLPPCDHRFHLDCIDLWFCSHSSCPLCRSPVEIEYAPTEKLPAAIPCTDGAIGTSSGSSSEVSIEIPRGVEELGQKSRMLAIRRFLCGDPSPTTDLERGEGTDRSTLAAGPPRPPPALTN